MIDSIIHLFLDNLKQNDLLYLIMEDKYKKLTSVKSLLFRIPRHGKPINLIMNEFKINPVARKLSPEYTTNIFKNASITSSFSNIKLPKINHKRSETLNYVHPLLERLKQKTSFRLGYK